MGTYFTIGLVLAFLVAVYLVYLYWTERHLYKDWRERAHFSLWAGGLTLFTFVLWPITIILIIVFLGFLASLSDEDEKEDEGWH